MILDTFRNGEMGLNTAERKYGVRKVIHKWIVLNNRNTADSTHYFGAKIWLFRVAAM
jgi:hypothetical protein